MPSVVRVRYIDLATSFSIVLGAYGASPCPVEFDPTGIIAIYGASDLHTLRSVISPSISDRIADVVMPLGERSSVLVTRPTLS
jgi:hypothetical protein